MSKAGDAMTTLERAAELVTAIAIGKGLKVAVSDSGKILVPDEVGEDYEVRLEAPRCWGRVILEAESLLAVGERPEDMYDYVEHAVDLVKRAMVVQLRAFADKLDKR